MFPSLRLGYVVVPADLVGRFAAMRRAMDLGPAHASQAVMAEFIREGHFARHIRRMRPIYAARRRALAAAVERELGPAVLGREVEVQLQAVGVERPAGETAVLGELEAEAFGRNGLAWPSRDLRRQGSGPCGPRP